MSGFLMRSRSACRLSSAVTIEPEPPPQLGVFTEAESISAITRFDGDLEPLDYLEFTTSALSYNLFEDPETLILGAGGGEQVLLALSTARRRSTRSSWTASPLTWCRTNMRSSPAAYTRSPRSICMSGRSAASSSARANGTISFGFRRSIRSARPRPGLTACTRATPTRSRHSGIYLARLEPGGLLSITLWVKLPPRDVLKLFATAVEALEEAGIDAGERLVVTSLFSAAIALPDAAKIVISLALIAALACFMGMPIRLGIASIAR